MIRIGVDTGGTFTDLVRLEVRVVKRTITLWQRLAPTLRRILSRLSKHFFSLLGVSRGIFLFFQRERNKNTKADELLIAARGLHRREAAFWLSITAH
jgi:hypothetical protein